jgi:hypothetical protein
MSRRPKLNTQPPSKCPSGLSPQIARTRLNGLSRSPVETNLSDASTKDVICVRCDVRSRFALGQHSERP